jgi:hypothetical protein
VVAVAVKPSVALHGDAVPVVAALEVGHRCAAGVINRVLSANPVRPPLVQIGAVGPPVSGCGKSRNRG